SANDVLLAINEMQNAVRPTPDDIAGVEPTPAPSCLGRRVVLKIAREATPARCLCRVAHQHFAGLAVRYVVLLIVDYAHVNARQGAAKGSRTDLARLCGIPQHAHHLRHTPDLDHGKTEALFELPV